MLAAGTRLGPYEVTSLLGRGGMAEVYRGRDERLGREVAIKVLPREFASDAEAISRFEREARAASALNHPHIITIYDIGRTESEDGPVSFIAMELIDGRNLREVFRSGERKPLEILGLFLQIAEGMAKAHDAGIIHRDLKPENVMVSSDGYAKILDFGLAKVTGLREPSPDELTAVMSVSRPGTTVGTLNYMSPEQIRGETLDGRSDVFAFGCMLFEGATGEKPFAGRTDGEVYNAILRGELKTTAGADSSAGMEMLSVAVRCLQTDREERYGSMREVAAALRDAARRIERPRRQAMKLTQVTFSRTIEASPAWSHDGGRLAFVREVGRLRRIVVRDLATGREREPTTGGFDELQPVFSPDGESILYIRSRSAARLEPADVYGYYEGTDIWSVDLRSGEELCLLRNASNPAFSPDGDRIAFDASWSGPRRIWVATSRGHNARQITTDDSDAVGHFRPRWSPDNRHLVFQNVERTKFDLRVVDVESQALRWVTNDTVTDIEPCWSPSGRFIYFSSFRSGGMNLWRVPVLPSGTPAGPLEQVTTGGGQDVSAAISTDGTRLAFAILRQNANIWQLPVDPRTEVAGEPEEVIATTREDSRGVFSPDQKFIAFNSDRAGSMHLWIRSVEDRAERQLTSGAGGDFQPRWSPDGSRIAFFSARDGGVAIWEVEVSTGEVRRLTGDSYLAVNPCYSPDGTQIAYHSDEDGALELWVMDADGNNRRQLTRCGVGGHFAAWADGESILFRCPTAGVAQVMKIAARGGEPEALPGVVGGSHISLSPDGLHIADVLNHKVLWVSRIDGSESRKIFEFGDAESRIDYPVWSPDGRSILFDRFRPQGGDVWVVEEFE
jgi:Tol biopolymer transport system component/predicted Ser/Thr protein kinase